MGLVCARRPGQINLTDYFPGTAGPDWPPLNWPQLLADGGLVLEEYREQLQRTRFLDIGALVYFIRTVPWAIPDFTVDRYRHQLLRLHEQIEAEGCLITTGWSILARATKV
jgi:hypothetical protein